MQGGELHVNGNTSVDGGTLNITDATLKLNKDVTVTSNTALKFGTLDMNNKSLTFSGSQGADLTLKKAFNLNSASTLQMSDADLTFAESATIPRDGEFCPKLLPESEPRSRSYSAPYSPAPHHRLGLYPAPRRSVWRRNLPLQRRSRDQPVSSQSQLTVSNEHETPR